MATPPEKPQQQGPLHNFSLDGLKWNKNHSSNLHRGRRLSKSSSSSSSSSSQHQSPSVNAAILHFQESLSLQQHQPINVQSQLPDSASKLLFTFNAGSSSQSAGSSSQSKKTDTVVLQPHSDRTVEKLKMNSPTLEAKGKSTRSKSKPSLRGRIKKKAEEVIPREEDKHVIPPQEEDKPMADEVEEEEQKTWNLRPRKPLLKPRNGDPGRSKVEGATTLQDDEVAHPPAAKSSYGVKALSKKPMFSLTLTREEIEEDIFAMTGSKPSRKPKNRPKAVQKQLDSIFPGMWLGSVTPDAYKVPDASKKN